MATFYFQSGDGFTAVMEKQMVRDWVLIKRSGGDPCLVGIRPFMFFTAEAAQTMSENDRRFFAGTVSFLDQMVKRYGHVLEANKESVTGWDGKTPFDNASCGYDVIWTSTAQEVVDMFCLLCDPPNRKAQ